MSNRFASFSAIFHSLHSDIDEKQYVNCLSQVIQSIQKSTNKHAPKQQVAQNVIVIPPQSQLCYARYTNWEPYKKYSITNWEPYKKYNGKSFFDLSKYWSHYTHVPQINTYAVKEKDMERKGG